MIMLGDKPHPDYHPTDLVTIRSVYGRRLRVRKAHLDDTSKVRMPIFNQYGHRLVDDGKNPYRLYIHRDNIAKESEAGI